MSKDFYHPAPKRAAQLRKRKGPRAWYEIALPGSQPVRRARPQIKGRLLAPQVAELVLEKSEAEHLQKKLERNRMRDLPPPCFFFAQCKAQAQCEKQGKAVCEKCAEKLAGQRYPLRAAGRAPIYQHPDELFRAMDYRDTRLRV